MIKSTEYPKVHKSVYPSLVNRDFDVNKVKPKNDIKTIKAMLAAWMKINTKTANFPKCPKMLAF